ncbi:MAG: prepilin peptidase [Bacilli bacterium]|nr:prepilin peptidase [Bacilli bacterium]
MNMMWSIYVFLIGAVLGSFYAVVATRLPKNESLLAPGSHCEYCNHPLKWYELIPIFSYLCQRGKCLKCHHHLPITYLLSEVGTGFLFLISYVKFGFQSSFFISIILSSLVTIIFISDMKYMIILDSPLLISIVLIFLISWLTKGFFPSLESLFHGLMMFGTFFLIGKLGSFLFKREALGGGDIKLSFIIGMTLGYKMGLFSFIFATFLALPYAILCLFLKEGHEVPFGPFLVSSLWIIFYFLEKFTLIWNYLFLL